MLKLIYITGHADDASHVIENGADWVMVDLERHGKRERQKGRNMWLTDHTAASVEKIIDRIGADKTLVRTDPLHDGTEAQLEDVLAAGAKHLMLPMFGSLGDVENYLRLVNDRASVLPLAETVDAVRCFNEVCGLPAIQRIHVGLNDLQISTGSPFLFEPVVNGLLQELSDTAARNHVQFGFGGVARVDEGLVPGRAIIAEHHRLRSSAVILSRTFRHGDDNDVETERIETFGPAVKELRDYCQEVTLWSAEQLEAKSKMTHELIEAEILRRNCLAARSNASAT